MAVRFGLDWHHWGVPHDEIFNANNEEDLEVVFRENERGVDGLNNKENGLTFQIVIEINK